MRRISATIGSSHLILFLWFLDEFIRRTLAPVGAYHTAPADPAPGRTGGVARHGLVPDLNASPQRSSVQEPVNIRKYLYPGPKPRRKRTGARSGNPFERIRVLLQAGVTVVSANAEHGTAGVPRSHEIGEGNLLAVVPDMELHQAVGIERFLGL